MSRMWYNYSCLDRNATLLRGFFISRLLHPNLILFWRKSASLYTRTTGIPRRVRFGLGNQKRCRGWRFFVSSQVRVKGCLACQSQTEPVKSATQPFTLLPVTSGKGGGDTVLWLAETKPIKDQGIPDGWETKQGIASVKSAAKRLGLNLLTSLREKVSFAQESASIAFPQLSPLLNAPIVKNLIKQRGHTPGLRIPYFAQESARLLIVPKSGKLIASVTLAAKMNSYDNLIKAAQRVVHNYRGLASGDLRAFVDDLTKAIKAADPQELTALRQENEALRAGLAELQRQAEGLREREAQLVSELAEAMKARGGVAV